MTLFGMCINVIAKPENIDMFYNQLGLIPVNVKTVLLKILCKRGLIKDGYVLKQLVNSKVIEVDLSECSVTENFLSCLHICKNLQKLDLSLRRRQIRLISTNDLISLFSNLPNLKVLAVPHCKEVNDEVIKTVSEVSTKLKELYIPHSSITDISLFYIGKSLHQLYALNVLGTMVTDTGIDHLTNGALSESLREINIDKCPNTTTHASTIVVKRCAGIKIFSCGSFGNDTELALAKQVFWSV